jgi:hypothetical protein
MSDIKEMIDLVIKNEFSETLKNSGYKKSGRNWKKKKENLLLFTNLQASSFNTSEEGQFTLNLAIFFPEADMLKNGPPSNDKPHYTDCILQERIGRLIPDGGDIWWKVDKNTDLINLGRTIAEVWKTYGEKWLENLSDYEKAKKWLLEYRQLPFWASIFALCQNKVEESKELLLLAINKNDIENRKDLSDYLRDWGQRHGVI